MTTCVLPHRTNPERARQAAEGLLCCLGCLQRMRNDLASLPDLDQELSRSHDARGAIAERTSGTHDAPIPARLTITILRAEIDGKTNAWARLICEDRDLAPWQHSDLPATVAFLETHLEWLGAQPFIDEYDLEISDLPRRAHNAIDPSHQPQKIPLAAAKCLEPDCDGTLTALVRGDEATPQDVAIRCSADDTHGLDLRRYLAFGPQQREAS